MTAIHPTALVAEGAQLGDEVSIGPYCLVGPDVRLGDRVRLISHVVIAGRTWLGAGCSVYPFASIGHAPQDLKYKGEKTTLEIGERTVIREHVTMSPGTSGGGGGTRVGSDCLFMVASHLGHDCQVGDHVVLANCATVGGHVEIGNHAILGGLSAVHQYVRIGAHAMVGGMSGVEHDVIPYGLVTGNRAVLQGLNIVGLKRRNFPRDSIKALRASYDYLFADVDTLKQRAENLSPALLSDPLVKSLVVFLGAESNRSLCVPDRAA